MVVQSSAGYIVVAKNICWIENKYVVELSKKIKTMLMTSLYKKGK